MKLTSTLSTVASALAIVTRVSARNCTSADLAGAYSEFRLTGGLGVYAPGTNQVVSYDHPKDSSITGLTAIDIIGSEEDCELDSDNVAAPIIISGIPATFSEDVGDKGGAVYLRLPVELPTGEYKYRLTLTTGSTDTCYLHSECFTSNGQEVIDSCSAGESRCVDATNFVDCVVDSASTNNGTFTSSVKSCDPGTSCTQTGTSALCTSGSAGPVVNPNPNTPDAACVVPGSMRCVNGTAWQQCIGGGDIWSWSIDVQSCASGTTCGPYQNDYIICQ